MRSGVILAIMLGLIGSASAQTGGRSSAVPVSQVAPDPLQEFEKIVKQCRTAVGKKNTPAVSVFYSSTTSSWVRRIRAFEVRYDVRRTDSLVAPIIGQIEVVEISATGGSAPDEKSAAALDFTLDSIPRHSRERHEATFVWRDQQWSFKEGTSAWDLRKEDRTYRNVGKGPIDASKGAAFYGPVGECFSL